MRVRNARELGLLIKDRRRRRSLSQADLARLIGASRHWVMHVEGGKPTVEVGLVLNALAALDLTCELEPATTATRAEAGEQHGQAADRSQSAAQPVPVDLANVLTRTRASGRTAS